MRDALVGALLAILVREAVAVYLEFRSKRPRSHVLRGNYFDARAPFAIARVGGPVEERSDERIEKVSRRLGRLRARRWTNETSRVD